MNHKTNDDFKTVLDSVDIVELVSEYVDLEKRGKNYFGLCPFHNEDTPSFSVSPEKKIAKCMGCGEGGNTITFYAKIKNISFGEALTELANRAGIKISSGSVKIDPNIYLYELLDEVRLFYTQYLYFSKTGQQAIKYLENRNINKEMIEKYKLGFAPEKSDALYQFMREKKYSTTDLLDLGLVRQGESGNYYDYFSNRLIFPITNPKGQTVGFSARGLSKSEKVKYLNSPESKVFYKGEILYNLNEASSSIRKMKEIYLTEGFFDVIKADQNKLSNIVATMGTSLTQHQVDLLARFSKNITLAFDGDEAGLKANLSALKSLLSNNKLKVSVLVLPNKQDLDDFFNQNPGEKGINIISQRKMDGLLFAYRYLAKNKDFTNSSDLARFKNEFEQIISNQSSVVFNYYEKLFKDENNFNINFNKTKTIKPTKQYYSREDEIRFDESNIRDEIEVPSSIIPLVEANLFHYNNGLKTSINAQFTLITELILQREHFDFIRNKIRFETITDDNARILLKAVYDYYLKLIDHNFVNLDILLNSNDDLKEIVNSKIMTHINWKSKITFETTKEINEIIDLVNSVELYQSAIDLTNELINNNDSNKEIILLSEITEIVEKIKRFELKKMGGNSYEN